MDETRYEPYSYSYNKSFCPQKSARVGSLFETNLSELPLSGRPATSRATVAMIFIANIAASQIVKIFHVKNGHST